MYVQKKYWNNGWNSQIKSIAIEKDVYHIIKNETPWIQTDVLIKIIRNEYVQLKKEVDDFDWCVLAYWHNYYIKDIYEIKMNYFRIRHVSQDTITYSPRVIKKWK